MRNKVNGHFKTIDANEAVASVAYRLSEVRMQWSAAFTPLQHEKTSVSESLTSP